MASNLNQREAALRAAMAKATLSERKRLNAEIKEIQAVRQAKAQQERSIDLSARDVRSTLTPVSVHGMHSFESDWVSDLDSTPRSKTAIRDIDRNARSEAAEWFRGVHAAVRADRIEFREQAKGFARRYASQFGAIAPDVEARTLQHIAGFYRQAEGTDMAGVPSAAGDGTNPDSTSWAEQVALPEDDAPAYETPEGITPGTAFDVFSDGTDEDWEDAGTEFSSVETPPAVTANSRRALRHFAEDGSDDDRVRGTNNDAFWDDAGYGHTDAEREDDSSKESGLIPGSMIASRARQFLGSEEGTTPPIPGEVDEEQDGEAKSSLPYQVRPTDNPASFPTFVDPATSKPAPSSRAKNVTSRRRATRRTAGMDPIGYTYEADVHCPSCAEARFGIDQDGFITGTDREGNEVGIIEPWSEGTPWGESCADCGVVITEPNGLDDYESSKKVFALMEDNPFKKQAYSASELEARGYRFEWSDDWDAGSHFDEYGEAYTDENGDPIEPETCENCILYDPDGEVIDSLGCIDDADDAYRKSIEEDMALHVHEDPRLPGIAKKRH